MGTFAIRAEQVSKQYRIGAYRGHNPTLRDAIVRVTSARLEAARKVLSREARPSRQNEVLWALKDVSFEIPHGDVVGIIGRNGAGKTTLLKVLSRITEPTSGRARIRGRVGSLLEVGTGFHPELTGRENVYLSGSNLGMRRTEINRRFEEIVEFAEVAQFLDMPVKRYSTGLQVRLAFAVAAYLEPEILLVDEVLAVGDVAFQRKCLGRMGDVASEGRTVLFVSHNMAVMQALCRRGIYLDHGALHTDSAIGDAIGVYLRDLEEVMAEDLLARTDRRGWLEYLVKSVEITSDGNAPPGTLTVGRPARFAIHTTGVSSSMSCAFTIFNHLGQPVAGFDSAVGGPGDAFRPGLGHCFVCEIEELALVPGRYRVNVELRSRGVTQDAIEAAAVFDVEQGVLAGRPVGGRDGSGDVALPHVWALPVG
jgi:lipopolysaccharide transport system ATP-binding protein